MVISLGTVSGDGKSVLTERLPDSITSYQLTAFAVPRMQSVGHSMIAATMQPATVSSLLVLLSFCCAVDYVNVAHSFTFNICEFVLDCYTVFYIDVTHSFAYICVVIMFRCVCYFLSHFMLCSLFLE